MRREDVRSLGQCTPAEVDALKRELEAGMPVLLTEVRRLLEQDWPDYADFLRREHDQMTVAVGAFVDRMVDAARGLPAGGDDPLQPGGGDLFELIGRRQWSEGRDLTTLLTAYQVGARAAWWHVSATALRLGVEPAMLAALAEAVFEFVGTLSSASARGYAQEQAESSRERERRRDELTQFLLSGRATQSAVTAAAEAAGWPLPARAALVLVDPADEAARAIVERAGSDCLRVRRDGQFGLIVPDPERPASRPRLSAALRGAHAVVGPAVPLSKLPASTGLAVVAERLVRAEVLTGDPVFVEDCLDTLIVHANGPLLAALRSRVLAPLDQFSPSARERLADTLTCWLRYGGDRQAVAQQLHIHPHTVRYRMAQLRSAFGSALDDPHQRARIFLALNWGAPPGTT
jgi:PucR C-terminal helix-turn-helix domain